LLFPLSTATKKREHTIRRPIRRRTSPAKRISFCLSDPASRLRTIIIEIVDQLVNQAMPVAVRNLWLRNDTFFTHKAACCGSDHSDRDVVCVME
jgi:hypothetical protein